MSTCLAGSSASHCRARTSLQVHVLLQTCACSVQDGQVLSATGHGQPARLPGGQLRGSGGRHGGPDLRNVAAELTIA